MYIRRTTLIFKYFCPRMNFMKDVAKMRNTCLCAWPTPIFKYREIIQVRICDVMKKLLKKIWLKAVKESIIKEVLATTWYFCFYVTRQFQKINCFYSLWRHLTKIWQKSDKDRGNVPFLSRKLQAWSFMLLFRGLFDYILIMSIFQKANFPDCNAS